MPRVMSRRRFLELAGTSLTAGFVAAACRGLPGATPPPAPSATPVPTQPPPATPPPIATRAPTITPAPNCFDEDILQRIYALDMDVQGERYEAQVPDTFDLQERANLAINALTRCTNPAPDYDVYFTGYLNRNPAVLSRQMHLYGKFNLGLAEMRIVTGNSVNEQVDQTWRKMYIGWLVGEPRDLWGPGEPETGRHLEWLSLLCRMGQDPCLAQIVEDNVQRMLHAAVCEHDFCYFPDERGGMPTGWDAACKGWLLQGVTQFYLATGSASAKALAAGLAHYLAGRAQVFDGDGRFLARHPSDQGPALHFHTNANALAAISEYAAAVGDEELARFAQKGYRYAQSTGNPLVGFFPEYIDDWPDDRGYIDCETCCIADMIVLALMLTECGQSDYWDDVDRYIRNQFAENQMTSGDWIDQIVATQPATPVAGDETGDHVSERVVGSFAGWAMANDYIPGPWEPFVSGCCTGNGARALYYVWDRMVAFSDDTLTIHLLLNRASSWADVNSYIPYEGRVDVVMKTSCSVQARIPEWVRPEEVSCSVNGVPRELTFRGRYAQVGRAESGSVVAITFPISERTVSTTIGDIPCVLRIKGNDVVSIDPPGKWYPFYQRARYRSDRVSWVKRQRFVRVTRPG